MNAVKSEKYSFPNRSHGFLKQLVFTVSTVSILSSIFCVKHDINVRIKTTTVSGEKICIIWAKMNENIKPNLLKENQLSNYLDNSQLQPKRGKFKDSFQKEKLQMV
ncbi:hypothetical protein F7734_00455 [Scytonema sp. UIC 10036]|uniref:hypothetical protein n=1 Tax=Scytonema sp. UIC 10036 TaxID=2304196 RepID=UPI0012DA2B6A|nr:hypothetical protein [Scytonema sp. UIC 10036]MUG91052.1 hypothetical protein [Scytonema sp. UIC 10036]